MSSEYGPLATEVYELDKPLGSPFVDVEYYIGLLANVTGPILEPATGTGRTDPAPGSLAPGGRLIVDVPLAQPTATTAPFRHWQRDT